MMAMKTKKEKQNKKNKEIEQIPLTRKCPQCKHKTPIWSMFNDRWGVMVCEGCYMENTDGNKMPIRINITR